MTSNELHILRQVIIRAGAAIVTALVVQSFALAIWVGAISARMDRVELDVQVIAREVQELQKPEGN